MIRYVELAEAKASTGVRMAVASGLPSPWSEGAKGVFRIAGVDVMAVRYRSGDAEVGAWMGAENVPAVRHRDEVVRTGWPEIVSLAARLDPSGGVLPADRDARIRAFGMLNEVAGEEGLAWLGRLHMIRVGLDGGPGFPVPVAQYLAARYGTHPDIDVAARLRPLLEHLDAALVAAAARGDAYLFGARPCAVDVYLAAALTPLLLGPVEECPRILPKVHAAFAALRAEHGGLVPARVAAHWRHMLERHLGMPIEL